MVASLRSLSNVDQAVQYFYYTEKALEASWHSSRAIDKLGLKSIKKEDLEAVLLGKVGGVELGQRTQTGIKHHPGQDLTFSAPKSVSIMALVEGDQRILQCHERAVSRALDYFQKNLVYTRVQKDGNLKIEKSDNAIIAKYTHITSRPTELDVDPQLHTHCLIANATLCVDEIWRSIVFDKLYENKMLLGEIYRMELIKELTAIGYEIDITRAKRFTFEIKGVSKETIEEFSKRRQEILREAEKRGIQDAIGLAQVTLATRHNKTHDSIEELRNHWKSRASINVKTKSSGTRKKIVTNKLMDLALNYAIKHHSSREAVFKKQELLSSMVERLAEFLSDTNLEFSNLEGALDNAVKDGKLLLREDEFTTPENIKEEKRTIKLMQSMLGKVKPRLPKYKINLKPYSLNSGQKEAVMLALTTKDRVVGIQGSAGTLKSTTLDIIKTFTPLLCLAPTKAAVRALKNHKAHTLSYFLKKYEGVLHKRGTKEALKRLKESFKDKLVVLDEASLASTSQVKKLLQLAKILKFRLLMVGDYRQLGAIPSGKPFYYLQNNGMNTCVMGEIKRQRNEQLLRNVYLSESAVDKKDRQAAKILEKIITNLGENVIDASKKNKDVEDAVYETWLSLKDKDPLVIAPSHYLREQLNQRIRPHFIQGESRPTLTLVRKNMTSAQMKYSSYYVKDNILRFGKENIALGIKAGSYLRVLETKKDTLVLSGNKHVNVHDLDAENLEVFEEKEMDIAVGDRIKWTRNSQKHDFIVNGKALVVKDIKDDVLEFETESGLHSISLYDSDMMHIDYDYTATVYGVQGRSKDYVIGVISSELPKELITQRAFYVILSRAKHGLTLVTDNTAKVLRTLAGSSGAKTSAVEHQEIIEGTNINSLQKEYFSPDQKHGIIPKDQFKNRMREIAETLFGQPEEINGNTLIFRAEELISLDLATGKYCNLDTMEDGYLYDLAKKEGLIEFYTEEQTKRIEYIQKLYKQSEPIRGTLAEQYLTKHRKINTQAFEFSNDMRFIKKVYSSETKSYHPALFIVGRDKNQNLRSGQIIYLDPNTQNKSKLVTTKRSIGMVKGSIIDLTPNTDAKNVFITEGIETALSIAQVAPNARVMASFGSSNLANIDVGPDKNIIICADNDGKNSSSKTAVENAARKLVGDGKVTVIMPNLIPGKEKTDFNDVLKVYGSKKVSEYIEPAITKGINYKKSITKLESSIAHAKQRILEATKKLERLGLFKDSKAALQKITEATAAGTNAKEALHAFKTHPEAFGELKSFELSKIKTASKHVGSILTNNKLLKAHQAAFDPLKAKTRLALDTKGKSIQKLEQDLEKEVFRLLKFTDNKCDFESVKKVTMRVMEQLVDFKERFGKDTNKTDFFLKARYELEREPYIKKQLSKLYSGNDNKMLLSEKLERALKVDSRLANKEGIYYKPVNFKTIRSILRQGDEKIFELTQSFENKGIECYAKAEFIAKEIVKYEEKHGTHMPSNHREFLDAIGNYVSRGYQKLCRYGFEPTAASRIMHREGAHLSLHRRKTELSPISMQTMKQIQNNSKDFYMKASATQPKENLGKSIGKSMEIER